MSKMQLIGFCLYMLTLFATGATLISGQEQESQIDAVIQEARK